jgi:hypothetical protein
MVLHGLHLLLTYQCTYECDHCFVWGSPWQIGTMTGKVIRSILDQAVDLGTVTSIYFEGGEPFLFYPVLVEGVQAAVQMGFEVGIVSNAYWATSSEDALSWLQPLKGLISDLSISSDLFHHSEPQSELVDNAERAAEELGIPVGKIAIAQPLLDADHGVGQLPVGDSGLMYRGRAAEKLASKAPGEPWEQFNTCPFEDLADPGRIHVDPFGNLHLCQGLVIGNLFETPLRDICEGFDPLIHPIAGPLLAAGPVGLIERFSLPHREQYADACHMCYEIRLALRERFPEFLGPDPMYGSYE